MADTTTSGAADALNAARQLIASDREALFVCHVDPATQTIPPSDKLGIDALAEYDDVLAQIDAALSAPAQDVPEIDYVALIHAAFASPLKAPQGSRACVAFKLGAERFREQVRIAVPPAQPVAGETAAVPAVVSDDDIWRNDKLMAINAQLGLPMQDFGGLVRSVIYAATQATGSGT